MTSTSSILKKSYISQSEDSDGDVKVPLTLISRTGRTTPSTAPRTPLPPIPKALTNFGMMGTSGIVTSLFIYLIDAATDAVLLWSLWNQNESSNIYNVSEVWEKRFYITLTIVLLPTIFINILSLTLYGRLKKRSGGEQALVNESKLKKATCIVLHILLLGVIVRYLDLLKCGRNLLRGRKKLWRRSSNRSRHSMEEEGHSEQNFTKDMHYIKSICKDTSLCDILYNHLKNSTQLVYQIFLIYRSRIIFNTDVQQWQITLGLQFTKIFVCLCSVTWSHVNFQEEFRRKSLDSKQLRCGGVSLCCSWRACMIGSRVLALASFAALRATPDGGLVKVDHYGDGKDLPLSFPLILGIAVAVHWLIMLIWIHAQKLNWCSRDETARRNECCEFLFSMGIAWVHVFCYVNMQEKLCRRRMTFYYILLFVENTTLMLLWYFQLISEDMWLRVSVLLLVEFLFLVGLSCGIGYYAFLHPNENRNLRV